MGMPNEFNSDEGPMPESCKSCAECKEPAATITSRVAVIDLRVSEAVAANLESQLGGIAADINMTYFNARDS